MTLCHLCLNNNCLFVCLFVVSLVVASGYDDDDVDVAIFSSFSAFHSFLRRPWECMHPSNITAESRVLHSDDLKVARRAGVNIRNIDDVTMVDLRQPDHGDGKKDGGKGTRRGKGVGMDQRGMGQGVMARAAEGSATHQHLQQVSRRQPTCIANAVGRRTM